MSIRRSSGRSSAISALWRSSERPDSKDYGAKKAESKLTSREIASFSQLSGANFRYSTALLEQRLRVFDLPVRSPSRAGADDASRGRRVIGDPARQTGPRVAGHDF